MNITNFYPRPPRGGRLAADVARKYKQLISIHALREEGDRMLWPTELKQHKFLSTPSARRATQRNTSPKGPAFNFYPRPPRGGRRS